MSDNEENNGTEHVDETMQAAPDTVEAVEGMLAPGDEFQHDDVEEEETPADDLGTQDVSILGKITLDEGDEIEVTSAILSEGAEWVKKPEGTIKKGDTLEFDAKGSIVPFYTEVKGTVVLGDGAITLFFDIDGADNHVSFDQGIGPTIDDSITHGPHCTAEWTIKR